MDEVRVLRKVGLAVFKDKKILMARTHKSGEVFNFLGGKIDEGESDIACLEREAMEEAGVALDKNSLVYLQTFEAEAYGHVNTRVNIKLYAGTLLNEPVPSAEVVELQYFESSVDEKHLSPTSKIAFKWLKDHGYIN